MKKKVIFDQRAYKDLLKFPLGVKAEFDAACGILRDRGLLEEPLGKKVDKDLFEIRIRQEGAWRGFYSYLEGGRIIVLHAFHKKTQRTPKKEIDIAKRRLRDHK